jgi:chaperonin cofactor prefoldin
VNNSRTILDITLANNIYSEESPTIMTFLSNGRVGIGITNPAAALHVQQTIRIGNSDATLEFGNDTTTQIVRNATTSELRFRTNSTNRLVIDSSGNVGIGITNPSQKLHVVGEIYTTGEITAFYSDERLKTKISTINNPLSIVNKLHGFYYIPNEIANKYGINKNKIEIGLSAQDVQKVLPELVKLAPFDIITNDAGEIISKSGEKYLTISYERLVPVLVEAIKELEIKNNSLNEKYENILQEISLIKKKINLNIE